MYYLYQTSSGLQSYLYYLHFCDCFNRFEVKIIKMPLRCIKGLTLRFPKTWISLSFISKPENYYWWPQKHHISYVIIRPNCDRCVIIRIYKTILIIVVIIISSGSANLTYQFQNITLVKYFHERINWQERCKT